MTDKKENLLNQLYDLYRDCDYQNPLYIENASRFVPGYGNPYAKIILIGEAPGDIEEKTGLPFQGRSGQLLRNELLTYDLSDKNLFITNVVKFRPPKNRKPTRQEIEIHFNLVLFHELALINPSIIVTIGAVATETILQENIKITKINGKTIKKEGKIIYPLLHPAYILRNMQLLKIFQKDIYNLNELLIKSKSNI